MKVKITRGTYVTGHGRLEPGDTLEVDNTTAYRWEQAGIAEILIPEPPKPEAEPKPKPKPATAKKTKEKKE